MMLDDSRKIIDEIRKHAGNKDMDADLDNDQRAMARLVGNTLSQSLFWCILYNKLDTN